MKSFNLFQLDTENQCLWRDGVRIYLAPKPFAVLHYLLERADRLVTQEELLNALWENKYVQPEILKKYVLEIRKVLGDCPRKPVFIETLPKRGYRFIATVTEEHSTESAASRPWLPRKLVGRDAAFTKLHNALRHARQGKRRIVFIAGELGIGKTALIDAWQQAACANGAGLRMAYSQSIPGDGRKELYYPMLDVLGQLCRQPEGEVVASILARNAPTWLAQLPSLAGLGQQETLQRQIPGVSQERMLREMCEALEAITSDKPMVLAFDDLHWADHPTVDLVSALARRRSPARLLILGAYRPVDVVLSRHPLKALTQDLQIHQLCEEIPLGFLEPGAVKEYLNARLPGNTLPNRLADLIYRRSDGNPLIMVAIVDHLVDEGCIARANDHWRLTTCLQEIAVSVPDTLRQMLELQLDWLCPEELKTLEAASIAGEAFNTGTIAAILDLKPAEAEDHCERLAEKYQLLRATGVQELPNGAYSACYELAHVLYRDVLFQRQAPARRMALQRRLETWLGRRRSGGPVRLSCN